MSEDITELRKDFTRHQIDEAGFRSEVSAYIKNAAEDIGEIRTSIKESTTAQWTAIDLLKNALADEETERKVEDVSLKGNIRMAGYAKIIAVLASLTLMVIGSYLVMFRGA